jgi:tripartite-type tricarboxylate transporter receptor subunit TctC
MAVRLAGSLGAGLGLLRPMALTAPKRAGVLPDVQTLAEKGAAPYFPVQPFTCRKK